jgi:molybdate transport system ATP-binding protein
MALEIDINKALPNFDLKVSFRAEEGEIKVITGPSGSGKTTLIRIIAGLERQDEGYVIHNGEKWVDCKHGVYLPIQQRRVGLVFQDYTLFPHLNVYDNVNFAAAEKEDVERFLRLFGIWELRNAMPDRISGGERQRCAICQNLARDPRVLLLDEPLSALDTENRRRLRRELLSLKESLNIPIVHVTHDLHEALFLGDEILSLVNGRIRSDWLQDRLEDLAEDELALRNWCESQNQDATHSLKPLRISSASHL